MFSILIPTFNNLEYFINLLSQNSYTRFFSLEIIIKQFFDSTYYNYIFNFFPGSSMHTFDLIEEKYNIIGMEIGLFRILIDLGIPFFLMLHIILFKKLKYFRGFIIISFI